MCVSTICTITMGFPVALCAGVAMATTEAEDRSAVIAVGDVSLVPNIGLPHLLRLRDNPPRWNENRTRFAVAVAVSWC